MPKKVKFIPRPVKKRRVKLVIPRWVVRLYAFLAVVLLPWTIYLSLTLPTKHITTHWDISWAGFDVGLLVVILITAWLASRKSRWVVMSATAAGSFLLVDAWFDIISEKTGWELHEAIALALLFEIPLALISFSVAYHVLVHNID